MNVVQKFNSVGLIISLALAYLLVVLINDEFINIIKISFYAKSPNLLPYNNASLIQPSNI